MTINLSDKRRLIKTPKKYSKELAEFFGILTGDGYIGVYENNYVIEIAGNKIKDRDYMEKHVSNLFYTLFNIKPNINFRKDQNTMYLKLQSKFVLEYLESKEFKRGVKGKISIPKWVKNDENFMKYFVKGIFDTDGCISFKRKEGKLYPTMNISSKSDNLLLEVKKFLVEKGISSYFATYRYNQERYKSSITTYQLQINGYKNIETWFKKIGSNNLRNLSKFYEMTSLRESKKL